MCVCVCVCGGGGGGGGGTSPLWQRAHHDLYSQDFVLAYCFVFRFNHTQWYPSGYFSGNWIVPRKAIPWSVMHASHGSAQNVAINKFMVSPNIYKYLRAPYGTRLRFKESAHIPFRTYTAWVSWPNSPARHRLSYRSKRGIVMSLQVSKRTGQTPREHSCVCLGVIPICQHRISRHPKYP